MFAVVLVAIAVAVMVPTGWHWTASKTFTVLGSLALVVGAFLQAWKDSSNKPRSSSGIDRLSLYAWAVICSGALSVLVGSVMAD
ncbi:hypothetical protein [Blastococcus atacamensis]|uniref:hypothetical protein n=1 Tax=Blastococcus atacamensis TaxID=2070508 RepID=UPI0012FFE615|nr:hypothetical protein [Blastococcus atacamensis]